MSEKRKSEETRSTKKRKWLTLEKKLEIIKRHENGASFAEIARENFMNESSVRTIMYNKEKIKLQGLNTDSSMAKVITRSRSSTVQNMEQLLMTWIEDCNQKTIPLSLSTIQEKALSLYNKLKKEDCGNDNQATNSETFLGSKGWFYNFKKRMGLHNVKIQGKSPSADTKTAELFPNELKKLIEKEGYTDEQIFNISETELFWKYTQKGMPQKVENQLTLVLGGNASGNLKLKPLVVSTEEHAESLQGLTNIQLRIHWRSDTKAQVTRSIFEDWFKNCFHPEAESYCKNNGIPFRILLLLDSAQRHLPTMTSDNVRIHVFPPETASILQPMDQGVIDAFKAYFLRRTFSQAIQATMGEEALTLTEFWRKLKPKDAVENVCQSWDEVAQKHLEAVWRNILPRSVNDFFDLILSTEKIAAEIEQMGRRLGLSTLDFENVKECPVPEQDYEMKVNQQRGNQGHEEGHKQFCFSEILTFIKKINEASDFIAKVDPNEERSSEVCQRLNSAIKCYRELLQEAEAKKRGKI